MANMYQENYKRLEQIFGDLRNLPEYLKLVSQGYMDLNMDRLNQGETQVVIALSHHYKHHSGDIIPDPDMEIHIDLKNQVAQALTYQDAYRFDRVYDDRFPAQWVFNPYIRKSLNDFLTQWLRNILNQGFKVKGGGNV